MTAGAWRDSVIAYIRQHARPVDKFAHQPRLYALAVRIGEGLEYDEDIVFAAAWMHDLGVFRGHRPEDPAQLARWDHVPYTIARTLELLPEWGFPRAKLNSVAEVIATHQPQNRPESTEAILLHDADILEQLGAIGISRALVKVGRDTRYETVAAVLPVLRMAADQLPGKLHLAKAKELARPRMEFLRLFIANIEAESDGLV